MKRKLIAAAAVAIFTTAAWAQMGPGMMGGYGPGGYGMGSGMMGGYGMGPGMMGGYGPGGYGVDLSGEQRAKLAEIQKDVQRKQWDLMGKMHEQGSPMHDAFASGKFDEQAARKAYDVMTAAHKQMFEISLEARKRMDAVFTPEQREQMQRGGRGR